MALGSIIHVFIFLTSDDSPVESSCTGVENTRNELKKQLDEQVKAAETVSDIIAGVGILESDMSFILEKLAIFVKIWAMVGILLLLLANLLKLFGFRSELTFRILRMTSN